MGYIADPYLGQDYTSFEAAEKGVLKPSKKWTMVCSITLTLGMCIGMGWFSWEQHQGKMDLEAQAMGVAEEMKKMMASSHHVADAKMLAEVMNSAAFDQNADQNLQAQTNRIADHIKELMADPAFVERANHVAAHLKSVVTHPAVQEQHKRFTDEMKTVLANSHSQKHKILGRRLFSSPPRGQLLRSPTRPTFPLSHGSQPKIDAMRPSTASRDVSMAAGKKAFPLLGQLGKVKFATALSEAGLLTSAEKAGVFSSLEKQGAFSLAESLLPLVDDLGLLEFADSTINTPAGELETTGTLLAILGPLYVGLVAGGVLPNPEGLAVVPGLVFTGTTAAGVAAIVVAGLLKPLQDGASIKLAKAAPARAAPAPARAAPAPARAAPAPKPKPAPRRAPRPVNPALSGTQLLKKKAPKAPNRALSR